MIGFAIIQIYLVFARCCIKDGRQSIDLGALDLLRGAVGMIVRTTNTHLVVLRNENG